MGRRRHRRFRSHPVHPTATGVLDPPRAGTKSDTQEPVGLTAPRASAYDPAPTTPSSRSGDRPRMASFGETLRRERELRRITLREVSEATKINIRYLEALERNEFTYLPGGAFTKAFIRAYAKYVGVDEAEMLNAYLYECGAANPEQNTAEKAAAVENLREHFQLEYGSDDRRRQRQRVLVLAIGGLLVVSLIAAAAWYLLTFQSKPRYVDPPRLEQSVQP